MSSASIDRIGLGGHDEIVFVQVAYFVCPPGDRDPAPLGGKPRMVAFFFGGCADGIRKRYRVLEVLELERSIQFGNTVLRDDPPIWNLGLVLP